MIWFVTGIKMPAPATSSPGLGVVVGGSAVSDKVSDFKKEARFLVQICIFIISMADLESQ